MSGSWAEFSFYSDIYDVVPWLGYSYVYIGPSRRASQTLASQVQTNRLAVTFFNEDGQMDKQNIFKYFNHIIFLQAQPEKILENKTTFCH